MIIDLIYLKYSNASTFTVAVIDDKGRDYMIGPVPSLGAIATLAPAVLAATRTEFGSLAECEGYLMFNHLMYMSRGKNRAGQSYPWRVNAPLTEIKAEA